MMKEKDARTPPSLDKVASAPASYVAVEQVSADDDEPPSRVGEPVDVLELLALAGAVDVPKLPALPVDPPELLALAETVVEVLDIVIVIEGIALVDDRDVPSVIVAPTSAETVEVPPHALANTAMVSVTPRSVSPTVRWRSRRRSEEDKRSFRRDERRFGAHERDFIRYPGLRQSYARRLIRNKPRFRRHEARFRRHKPRVVRHEPRFRSHKPWVMDLPAASVTS
jgi:hypothetical protein